jgi:hypothetical protein
MLAKLCFANPASACQAELGGKAVPKQELGNEKAVRKLGLVKTGLFPLRRF